MPRGNSNLSKVAEKGNHDVSIKRKLNHNNAEYSYNSGYGGGYYDYYYGYYNYGQSYYYDSEYGYYTYYYGYDSSYDYYDYYNDYWYYSYDYYYYGYYDDYYGQNSYYDGHTVRDGDGNSDVNADFTGAQDWDDWHEAEGQSKDDEWTGDINDFLEGEGDDRHDEAVWSGDNDGPSFWDDIGDIITHTHTQHAIAHDFSWVTWATEDVDFWDWFWPWYANLDSTWTFDHEPGWVQNDPDYEWEWFQEHTAGHNVTSD